MPRTKFFRVAVEGQTATDGRTITRDMISEAVGNFNAETFGVRINMEHLRGFSPQPPFNAYGDVTAVRAEDVTLTLDGKTETRLALLAQLDPTEDLVRVNKARQKIYSSVELQPNFAGTGKFGLVGLAVTDSPASLGTEILKFSARADDAAASAVKADLDRRKQAKDNLFSAAQETAFEIEDEAPSKADSAVERFLALFSAALGKKDDPRPDPIVPPAAPADDGNFAALFAGLTTALAADRQAADAAFDRRFSAIETSIGAVKADLEKIPAPTFTQRPAATGGAGRVLTDC